MTDGFGSIDIDWEAEPVPSLAEFEGYQQALSDLEFDFPETFNIAADVVTRHADKRGRVALVQRIERGDGTETDRTHTFWQLDRWTDRLANALVDLGVTRGDRIAVIADESDRAIGIDLAAWKLGAVSVPLSVLYGPDGLGLRLGDAGPVGVFATSRRLEAVSEALSENDRVEFLVGTDEPPPAVDGVETASMVALTADQPAQIEAVETDPTDPAFILYTSGTTGEPKGVVQDHQTLIGWLPGYQMCFELPWHDVDPFLYATPDFAWIGGLNLVLGAWHYGFPVLVHDSPTGFDPEVVFENIDRYGPNRAVLVPGMLKAMRGIDESDYDLSTLRVVMSGSEPVSESLHEYVLDTLGANLNEMYGQTEALHIVSSCSQWHDADAGSMGYAVPGHDISIVDEDGISVPPGEVGIIGLRSPDPAMFNKLWNDPSGTEARFIGDWMDTDDLGYREADGQFWFKSRGDNLIITRGYRVGPAEVEDSILQLSPVADVGVSGVDREGGGQIIKAFVVLEPGHEASEAMKESIRTHVKEQLAMYQYPREIEFRDDLPKTVTGKIKRHELS